MIGREISLCFTFSEPEARTPNRSRRFIINSFTFRSIHIRANLPDETGFDSDFLCKFKSKHMCRAPAPYTWQVRAFGTLSSRKWRRRKIENLRQRPLRNVMLMNSSAWTAFCHDTETKNWRIRNILITNFQSHTLGLNLLGYRAGKAAFLVSRFGDLAISLEIRLRAHAMESK